MSGKQYLAVNRCPKHGVYSVSLDDDNGGMRITPTKCCGTWTVCQRWPLTEELAQDVITEIECAVEESSDG